MTLSRRDALALGLGAPLLLVARPARATPETMAAAVADFTGGAPATEGRITLDIPLLVENGNAIPVTVTVDSPMTADDHVQEIVLFNERNPLPEIVRVRPSPAMGRASLQTRIRLGDTQRVHAYARMSDGSLWTTAVNVIVTAPACIEG
jgi:sulfur-oxidizing protein SoxY